MIQIVHTALLALELELGVARGKEMLDLLGRFDPVSQDLMVGRMCLEIALETDSKTGVFLAHLEEVVDHCLGE